jgi:lipopolysaccharide export system permease protein
LTSITRHNKRKIGILQSPGRFFLPKKAYAYILLSYAGPLALTFTISLFILVMQFLWKYIDDLVGKGLEWYIILELLFYAAATFVPLALPLSILFASLMTFGSLGEKYELVAMKAAGISLSMAMKPLIVLTMIISLSAFFFANNVMPVANLKMFSVLNGVREKKPAVNIRPGIFYREIDGLALKVSARNRDGKGVRDILIYDYTNPASGRYNALNVTVAKQGVIEFSEDDRFMTLTLIDGTNYAEQIEGRDQTVNRPLQRTSFARQHRLIDLSAFAFSKTNEEFLKDDFRMMSLNHLNYTIDSMYTQYHQERGVFVAEIPKSFRNLYADTLIVKPEKLFIDSLDRESQQGLTLDTSVDANQDNIAQMPPRFSGLGRTTSVQLRNGIIEEVVSEVDSVMLTRSYYPKYGDSILPNVLKNYKLEEQNAIVTTALQLARSSKESMNSRFNISESRIRLIRKYEIEWHRKFTLSIACLILFFVGAPLGAIIRKGGLGMPAVLSVVLFILFHVLSMTGDKLARESTVSPVGGMWMASLIFLPVGVFLTIKATGDAALLDAEAWQKGWKKIIAFIRNQYESITNKQ